MGWMNRSGLIMAVGLTLSILSGCAKRPVSFELLLARIDALGLQASADTFSGAASLAVTSADKLRLLERARLLDPGLAADTASLLLDQGSASVVGLAALDLFLEAGRFEAAFGLFPVILPPSEFPLAFAETLVRAKQAGQASLYTVPDHSWLILAYDSTGRTEFLYEAILTVLEAGDTGSARLMMDEFVAHGAADELRPSTEMLWHHGFLDLILNLGPRDSSYDELAAYADSALMTGRRALAVSVYAELLERYPRHSWQPYAAIARLSEQASSSPEVSRLPLAPVPLQGNPEAGYWYARMINQFPEDSSAALEYGLWLARKGFGTAALPYFDETGVMPEGEATASARLALVGMDSLPLAAIELAATYPDSALAMDSALAALFTTGSWKRFLSMNAWREVAVKRAWFWDTVSLALTADFDAAILSLEESSPMIPGFEVSYTMAALKAASGRHKDAAMYYQMSANEVVAVDVKARCMVRAGDSFVAAGDLTAAVNAYNAALTIDDFNHEAMAALRRLPER
jgi:tetratricopeptide (TPR) repeat protein